MTTTTTTCTHTPTFHAEWIDERLPFFDSLVTTDICEDCADELEANEFIELTVLTRLTDI